MLDIESWHNIEARILSVLDASQQRLEMTLRMYERISSWELSLVHRREAQVQYVQDVVDIGGRIVASPCESETMHHPQRLLESQR